MLEKKDVISDSRFFNFWPCYELGYDFVIDGDEETRERRKRSGRGHRPGGCKKVSRRDSDLPIGQIEKKSSRIIENTPVARYRAGGGRWSVVHESYMRPRGRKTLFEKRRRRDVGTRRRYCDVGNILTREGFRHFSGTVDAALSEIVCRKMWLGFPGRTDCRIDGC